MNHWRAACGESLQARFGGGPMEKCPWKGQLASGLPNSEGGRGPRDPRPTRLLASLREGMSMDTGSDDVPPEHDPTDAERAALLVRESWWLLLALLAFLLFLRTI